MYEKKLTHCEWEFELKYSTRDRMIVIRNSYMKRYHDINLRDETRLC